MAIAAPTVPALDWERAELVAAICAVDPRGCGGAIIRAQAGPARDAWLRRLGQLLPEGAALRRVPPAIGDDRLIGGLDLAATLRAGHPVAQAGVLAQADQGIVVLAMAERIAAATAARITAVMDTGMAVQLRDGLTCTWPARFGVIAFDEGIEADETIPPALRDRLAFCLPLDELSRVDLDQRRDRFTAAQIAAARARLPRVQRDPQIDAALVAAAVALGVHALRPTLLAVRAAAALAALEDRIAVDASDASRAAALVLAWRATRLPAAASADDDNDDDEPQADDDEQAALDDRVDAAADSRSEDNRDDEAAARSDGALDDLVLTAAHAAIPAGLLHALMIQGSRSARRSAEAGRAGALQTGQSRGRPIGVIRRPPRGGARLHLIETLRAAAPWQSVRRLELQHLEAASGLATGPARSSRKVRAAVVRGAGSTASTGAPPVAQRVHRSAAPVPQRILIRGSDFRTHRFAQRRTTTTVFVVDASGSAALHRLAEAKGAVELLLADCYVRRDQVALIAFRGKQAELILAPTRSLVRAKRALAGLPGGGGTPLASGLDAAAALAQAVARRGATPVIVVLTDGRANIARDGTPGRAQATADALQAARAIGARGLAALLIDTSPQPQPAAAELAGALRATYLPLPHANAAAMTAAVRGVQVVRDRAEH